MDTNELKGKRLLILAGADVHCKVVEAAKSLGVYTIVTDYLDPSEAPAKRMADEYWMLNIYDVDAIVAKCIERRVDGVITFCIDPTQIPYQQICERLGKPCYGTRRQFEIMTNKRLFKDFCNEHGVDTIPEYTLKDVEAGHVAYPVLVKPAESRGSRGQTVCNSADEVHKAIETARAESADGNFLIERYMTDCRDMSLSYIVIDGTPYLLKIGDRYLGDKADNLDRQQIATLLPSVNVKQIVEDVHPAICAMLRSLGLEFGAAFFQGFWKDGRLYMYDPGLRFPGSDFDIIMRAATGFDNMKSFVRFALTGDTTSCYGSPVEAYMLGGTYCLILSVSVCAGTIAEIEGFEAVKEHPYTLSAAIRRDKGETIEATGDVRQRAAEFVAHIPTYEEALKYLDFVYETFHIYNEGNNDMIISRIKLN